MSDIIEMPASSQIDFIVDLQGQSLYMKWKELGLGTGTQEDFLNWLKGESLFNKVNPQYSKILAIDDYWPSDNPDEFLVVFRLEKFLFGDISFPLRITTPNQVLDGLQIYELGENQGCQTVMVYIQGESTVNEIIQNVDQCGAYNIYQTPPYLELKGEERIIPESVIGLDDFIGNTTEQFNQVQGQINQTQTNISNTQNNLNQHINNYNSDYDDLVSSINTKEPISTYLVTILKPDIVWFKDWVSIALTSPKLKKVNVKKLVIKTESGDINAEAIISHPSSEANNGVVANYFYLKDKSGILTQFGSFESIYIEYSITNVTTENYDFQKLIDSGLNVVFDENINQFYHSDAGVKSFKSVYPDFSGQQLQTVLLLNDSLYAAHTPKFMVDNDADIISRPYANASVNEEYSSNPNVLTVASHYNNPFTRVDITANASTFLKHTIAVGSCPNVPNPSVGTSYGFGVEFFEPGNNDGLDALYPDVLHRLAFTSNVILDGSRLNVNINNSGMKLGNVRGFGAGSQVIVGALNGTTQTRTVLSITDDQNFVVSAAFDPIAANSYVWFEVKIGTYWQYRKFSDYPINQVNANSSYQQSPVCAIVMAKLKKIKDSTGATWPMVRLAARETASNSGVWDMYRGFGIINVDAAVIFIESEYKNDQTYQKYISDNLRRSLFIDPLLKRQNIHADSPIPRRVFEEVVSALEARIEALENN